MTDVDVDMEPSLTISTESSSPEHRSDLASSETKTDLPPMTFMEKRILGKAAHQFMQKDFTEASNLFLQVLSSRPEDSRVTHNLAIAQFYQNHLLEADRFQQQFLSILSKANISTSTKESPNEIISHHVFLYNLAVIYFHDRQPWKSLEIAFKVLKHLCSITSCDELAVRTRLLITELYISLQKYDLALEMSQSVELLIDVLTIDPTGKDDADSPTMRLSEIRHVLKVKMREHQALSLLSTHSVGFGRLHYADFRDLIRIPESSDDSGRIAVQFLKAYHNYLGGNIRKALAVMSAISINNSHDFFTKTGDNVTMMLNNNIGCCHYSMGKPTVAAWYFQKASQDSNKEEYKETQKLPLHCLSFNRKYEIMYNFGVSLLQAKKSMEAFNVLTRCQTAFSDNPRLWLRISECCVQLHKPTNAEDFAWTDEKRNIFLGIDSPLGLNKGEQILQSEINNTEKLTPTLLYGRHCIEMALSLVKNERFEVRPSNPVTDVSEIITLRSNIFCTGAYINLALGNFTEAIQLANDLLLIPNAPNVFHYLGKLYLCEAMFKSGSLQNVQDIFPEQCISNYHLNLTTPVVCTNVKSSIEKVPKERPSRLSSPSSFKPASEWVPREDLSAKATMMYNRAVALSEINQFELALGTVEDWIGQIGYNNGPIPPDFILLCIHLNLKLGNVDRAAEIYRQHSPVKCRVPLSSTE